jgi:hypothetical protein
MILIALSAFVAGVSMTHAAPLSCDEAKGHIGEQATVCGLVASAAYTRSQTTFLNLCKPYPNQDFFAVIFKSDRDKFDEKLGPREKVQEKKGCDVCVTGKIQPYQGKLEIILNDPKQLEIRRCETRSDSRRGSEDSTGVIKVRVDVTGVFQEVRHVASNYIFYSEIEARNVTPNPR